MRELHLTEIVYTREGRQVLGGLSLRLTEGRIGLIGRNGAGKSQLLRLMAGLAAPESGTVRIGTPEIGPMTAPETRTEARPHPFIDPFADRRAAIAQIGILFQNPDHQIIFPTVEEELAFGLGALGLDKAATRDRVTAILARFNRADWAGRNVQSLSQGQRHLLCLMAVLAMDPATILLDEPFTGIDLATALRLNALIDALPQQVIHVTHDLEALAGYDRVIWLDAGQVVQDGPPAPVIRAYRAAMEREAQDDRADI